MTEKDNSNEDSDAATQGKEQMKFLDQLVPDRRTYWSELSEKQ
jgi:hypothetical protein